MPLPEPTAAFDPDTADLPAWLAYCEAQHHKIKDRPLNGLKALRGAMGIRFEVPLIVVAGTNGKGSTCAFIDAIARHAGYRVGLYTKPHLLHFEERCVVNGQPVAGQDLVPHFQRVEAARLKLGGLPLTWFEYTTFAIASLLASLPLDLVVLEVGLGGRLDAVNVFDADCAVLTSIALDHTEILGPDRETIGWEKVHIARAGQPLVVCDPLPPASVLAFAEKLGADTWLQGRDFNHNGDRQQWNWAGRGRRYSALAYPALRGANQLLNASGAIAALESLRERLPVTAQAVRNGLALVHSTGRFQIIPGQPTLVLDVAHNPQAVAALAANLDAMAYYPRTRAVFGAMHDKDLNQCVKHLLPVVDNWHCCNLPLVRAASAQQLAQAVQSALAAAKAAGARLPLAGPTVALHETPAAALQAALAAADPADRIVVFGSFRTVGGVLGAGLPRLASAHLPS